MLFAKLRQRVWSILFHSSLMIPIKISCVTDFFSLIHLLTFFSTLFLIIDHKFSIGFKSGEYDGQSRTAEYQFSRRDTVSLALCFGSLSCWYFYNLPRS